MGAINRVAVGLQSLLGAKAFGVNPNAMTETLLPTLDQYAFLSADIAVELSGDVSAAIAANSNTLNASISVPAGEAWQVISAEARFLATIAGVGDCQLKMKSPGASISVGLTECRMLNSISSSGIGFTNAHVWSPPSNFIAGPGLTFEVWGQNGSGGSGSYLVAVIYRQLVV